MIKIYGSPRSSAGRCYVMLEEAGLAYEGVSLDLSERHEHKAPEYMKLNPNGKVPCLVDGDFVLWESAAIVQYVAEKYKPEMMGSTLEDRALVQQWAFWTMTEAQPPLVDLLIQKMFVPEEKRNLDLIARREKQVPGLLSVLDNTLANKKYLVKDRYSVADLMAASAVNIAAGLQLDLSPFPHIRTWFQEIKSRPAWKAVDAKRRSP